MHAVALRGESGVDGDAAFRDAEARLFEVAALLSKAPLGDLPLEIAFDAAAGGSYFLIATPMVVETPWGQVRVDRNDRGEASMISMYCEATSSDEALIRLRRAASVFLDHWSFRAMAPTFLTRLRAIDTKHDVHTIQFNSPYRTTMITASTAAIPTPLRAMLALYGEALCASSPIYRFLCLYKILEGYFGRLKPELAKVFKHGAIGYQWPKETVPDHKDYGLDLRRYVNGPIAQLKDEQLTPHFRDASAHFSLDGELPLIASDPKVIKEFNHVGIAADLCARVVIEVYRDAHQAAQDAGLDLSSLVEAK